MKFSHMIPHSISFKSCLTQFSVKCNGKFKGAKRHLMVAAVKIVAAVKWIMALLDNSGHHDIPTN